MCKRRNFHRGSHPSGKISLERLLIDVASKVWLTCNLKHDSVAEKDVNGGVKEILDTCSPLLSIRTLGLGARLVCMSQDLIGTRTELYMTAAPYR